MQRSYDVGACLLGKRSWYKYKAVRPLRYAVPYARCMSADSVFEYSSILLLQRLVIKCGVQMGSPYSQVPVQYPSLHKEDISDPAMLCDSGSSLKPHPFCTTGSESSYIFVTKHNKRFQGN
ncbi:hypothetical protein NPIL_256841 [Nephila pilipes]|uniref:Uncharacterized protein n=1 Tax=Nephila pilipes TaxID=299642 RepID=A0A8X6NGR6_NEPPI|nr:hypothetical protein NPIL_256841 [Nephila pilipes]